jgi:anti-sigma B factor antagonist
MVPVKFEENGGVLVVTPGVRRLDALVASDFRTAVGERASRAQVVVMALKDVGFIDSSGLAALISVLKRLQPGGQVRLAEPGSAIRSLLAATRLEKVFPVYDTVAAAVAG